VSRHRPIVGPATAAFVCGCALVCLSGVGVAAPAPVSLTLNPTTVTPPGSVTATVTIQGVPSSDIFILNVSGKEAQVGMPSVVSGDWTPTCSGQGTFHISCSYSVADYPLVLDIPITVPSGVQATTWTVTALEEDTGASAQAMLTIEPTPPPTTTTVPTTTTTTTSVPTTTTTSVPTNTVTTDTTALAPTSTSTTRAEPSSAGQLAATGFNLSRCGSLGFVLVLAGTGSVYVSRRRHLRANRHRQR
jgi:hypothetical protein